MTRPDLTEPVRRAHKPAMGMRRTIAGVILVVGSALAGAFTVTHPPAEPIVIELNVNITQEVVYRLADDVRQNIDENPEIF